ncbi:histidine phosphatase family protein [Candidatus Dojkabacteria bacterium]|uniref:phosphoglycerate mutase (2,3-diphosphoglycerate-dependent) n=1 Tax=Candidatus Dojkabacteria bacterium TaxID=2099670 RepID=A0A955LB17_9BACT|nr:histidine phosphatase family protein [Candidatus Dojkabacteria bacterium]
MKNYIYLFRHTQSTDNEHNIFSGDRKDINLSEAGKREAQRLREKLKDYKFEVAIASPLKRSVETLDIVLEEYHPNVERIVDERIKERDYGILEGRVKQKVAIPILNIWANIAHRSYVIPPPGGENFIQVWNRVMPFVHDLEDMIRQRKVNVAICGHNNSMRPIRAYFEHKTPRQMLKENSEHGVIYEYEIDT